MRSLLASEYRYIKGSMQRTEDDWRDYASTLADDMRSDLSVHFIPALGGCFVVAEIEQRHSPLSWLDLLPLGSTPSRHVESVLDGFIRWRHSQRTVTSIQRA
jgi:hypothetical protein